mmetsp:Transcript_7291/g.19491  ORF Transcript_7291/g.19491 Transcript_7291/m.19491 type:complete len:161 (-) Transcript_7291:943-1425(-)
MAFVSGGCGRAAVEAPRQARGVACGVSAQSRVRAQRRARAMGARMMAAGKAEEVDQSGFDKIVAESNGVPILVDFFAVWCGPCKLMAPLMDWAVSHYGDKLKIVKVDTEKNPAFVKRYKIYGLPTLAIFKDGESIAQVEGAMSKQAIQDFISENLPELKA